MHTIHNANLQLLSTQASCSTFRPLVLEIVNGCCFVVPPAVAAAAATDTHAHIHTEQTSEKMREKR